MGNAFFQDNGFGEMIYAFLRSDWLGKSICVLLALISAGIWSIIVEKRCVLRNALKDSRAFLQGFLNAGNLFEMQSAARQAASPAGEVYLSAVRRFKSFDAVLPDKTCRPLTEKEINLLRTTMERSVEDQLLVLEKRTMILASAVGVCPFLGLFGTVWGITVAFCRLAQAGQPDIQTLAPGVSGALLTTVLALVAVIPAMLGNNYIVSLLRNMTTLLDDAVEEIIARFQTEFMGN
jgi:biopolymer transport protein TolQ